MKVKRFGLLVGDSPAMRRVYRMVNKAARNDIPVLVTGETGTGKDLVAHEIHKRSARRKGPFIAVNMGVLRPELVASELFGHVKGAFTGAQETKLGRFAEADGGTLFLDEVTTMDDAVQVALLRVLEDGWYHPLGAKKKQKADVRLITATNIDLREAVTEGLLREDLLHRLRIFSIDLPPLRQRLDDIPMLSQRFLEEICQQLDHAEMHFSEAALEKLTTYVWAGNVRELKHSISHAAVMAEDGTIEPAHLPHWLVSPQERELENRALPSVENLPDPQYDADEEINEVTKAHGTDSPPQEGLFFPLGMTLEEVQRTYALKVLANCANNKTSAAKILGISRKTLHDRLRRWGVTALNHDD